jgi:hypothetical protein
VRWRVRSNQWRCRRCRADRLLAPATRLSASRHRP